MFGGISGALENSSKIENCYNIHDVLATAYSVGGIVGISAHSTNIINSCYNVGNITGTNNVGQIIGSNSNSKIINCYSKDDSFTSTNLGTAYKENINNGYPILSWQE